MTKVGVVRFPGSNSEDETVRAAQRAGLETSYLWHKDHDLSGADVVILPGGFAYGDYLRAGAIARFSPLMREVIEFANRGGPVLGICNGFQVLCEAGLLEGALVRNECLSFISRPLDVKIERTDTPFTSAFEEGQVVPIQVSHGEGRFVADKAVLESIEAESRVVARYVGDNPNGSANAIAGICNQSRNVVGMMPHPERVAHPLLGEARGQLVFESLMRTVEAV